MAAVQPFSGEHGAAAARHLAAFADAPPILVAQAPGRVNLIGEHTDYSEGFVMPMALPCRTTVSVAPRDDGQWVFRSTAMPTDYTIAGLVGLTDVPPRGSWQAYPFGVMSELQSEGITPPGANVLIHSDVPLGAGLSSSAALEASVACALLALAGVEWDARRIAALCRRAEHRWAGTPCGVMDQLACLMGQVGHAMLLDCRSLQVEQVRMPDEAMVMVINTQVRHELSSGAYAERVEECRTGVNDLRMLGPVGGAGRLRTLRDATARQLHSAGSRIDPIIYQRCQHVIEENERVPAFAEALREGDLAMAGRLMYESHASLRDLYEVSCEELDSVVNIVRGVRGVYGARMTGGGFGGCVVALASPDAEADIGAALRSEYDPRHDRPALPMRFAPSGGAMVERLR